MGVKLVMEEKEGPKVIIGISNDNCDPIIETVEGYIEDAMGRAYRVLRKAETQWNIAPKYPEYKVPVPKQEEKATKAEKFVDQLKKNESKTKETATKKPGKSTKPTKNIPDEMKKTDPELKSDEVNMTSSVTSWDKAVEPANMAESVTPALPLLAEEPKPERKCRVCGCTDDKSCEEGCHWVEKDLCSACADKEERKPGLYLQDGRGPFESVQEALDEYGAPKDTRPQHNRYDRLSRAWKEIIIRKV